MEIWKDVVGYEGYYEVSNLGNVRSVTRVKKGKQLKPIERRHGYLAVQLHGKGGNERGFKVFSIHRLVAEAFISNPNNYPEVNHIDEDKGNNRERFKGRKSHRARPIIQYDRDGNMIAEFESASDAGKKLGFDFRNIQNALYKGHLSYGYFWKFKYTKE